MTWGGGGGGGVEGGGPGGYSLTYFFDYLLFLQELSLKSYQISLSCHMFSPALLKFGQCVL